MNNMLYPIWWDTSITIFNKYINPQTSRVKWYKTVVDNCFMQYAKSIIAQGQITYDTNNIIVRIPQSENFKEYGEWINIPNVDMNNYFTLHSGDIIIKGSVNDIIDEYTEGKRANDLIEKYKDIGICFTIDSWQNNTGIGRISPHYFATGA